VSALTRNGWEIYFYTPLFGTQRRDLKEKVRTLKAKLSESEYVSHTDVKLYKSVMVGIKEKIVLDPFGSDFSLTDSLKRYCRLKGMGLPERYRLFFRACEADNRKILVILWLGHPRKQGDKRDCYKVFTRMVERGNFPESVDELLKLCEQ
jgi:toxin YhaV